jgi:hypothetical protein
MFDYPDEGDGPAASFKLESKLPAAGRIITNGQARALSCFACFRRLSALTEHRKPALPEHFRPLTGDERLRDGK